MRHGGGQRARIGAVAVIAIERDAARLGRKRNQGPRRRLHLGEAPAGRAHAAVPKRVVAAGVEQQQVDPCAGFFHCVEDAGQAGHLREHIAFIGRMGVDRHQVIEATGLDPVSGIIKQRDVGADQFMAEFLQGVVEGGFVEVELRAAADHEKAERQQRIRHQPGVGRGVGQRRHRAIGRIADHQRHPLVGMRRRAQARPDQECRDHQSRHDADPTGHDRFSARGGEFPASHWSRRGGDRFEHGKRGSTGLFR
jgi:hypothetical protein